MAKRIELSLTQSEMLDLISLLDTVSALMEQDKTVSKELKKVDKMLLRNGYKRLHN